MEDFDTVHFASFLQGQSFILALLFLIIIAGIYFRNRPHSPNGVNLMIFGFSSLFLSKLLTLLNFLYAHIFFVTLEISAFSLTIGLFIAAGLTLKGMKAINFNFAFILSSVVFGFMAYAVFIAEANYIKYFLLYFCYGISFGFLAFGFFPKNEKKSSYGFYLSSLGFSALSVINLLMITGWGRQFFSTNSFVFLYFIVALSLILASVNLLEDSIVNLTEEVKAGRNRFRLIVQSSPFPIIISRLKDERFLLANDKAKNLLGINSNTLSSYILSDFFVSENFTQELFTRLERSKNVDNFEVRLEGKKAPSHRAGAWLQLSTHVIDFEYEIALYSVVQDITARKKKELELFNDATRDSLTSCYTRRFFEELAQKEIQRSIRYNRPFSMMMIDADHFKNVNDTYGHGVGDKVLKTLANTCYQVLRPSDIICRFGGEEFIVLLVEVDLTNALIVANRLRETIERLIVRGDNDEDVCFTVSMGLVPSSYSTDYDALIKAVDNALYQAKDTGRNKVVVYNENQ